MVKRIVLFAVALIALTQNSWAQDKVEASVSADIVSKSIWRGQELGDAAIQPTLGVSYKGFSLEAWGNCGLVNSGEEEIDLTLSYTIGNFNVGITDYYVAGDGKYFEYAAHKTAHTFEANIGYDFGVCSLQWFTNFAGADGVNKDGDRAYSSYVEVSAPFNLGGMEWNATVGAVPFATDYYDCANGFAVTNVSLQATKEIKITDSFSLPVFANISANPSTQKAYFAIGLTLEP